MEIFKELLWYWYIYPNRTASDTHQLFHQHLVSLSDASPDSALAPLLPPSLRTLQRRLQEWDFIKYNQVQFGCSLDTRLWVLFYAMGLNASEMLGFLIQEGYPISIKT